MISQGFPSYKRERIDEEKGRVQIMSNSLDQEK